MRRKPVSQFLAVKLVQRHGGQPDFVPLAAIEESIEEHLAGMPNVDAIDRLAQGAHQHQVPEARDGAFGLAVSQEPLQERFGSKRRPGSRQAE